MAHVSVHMAESYRVVLLALAVLAGSTLGGAITWNGNWAFACDFYSNDLASAARVPGDQCSSLCAARSGCTHYTWTAYNGGTCWMKSGAATKADAIPTNDATTLCGVLPSSVAWQGDWAFACDFRGADLAAQGNTPGARCSSVCQARPGCTHYTWTTYNGGTCWMKQGPATKQDAFATSDSSMVCGVLPGSSPTSPPAPSSPPVINVTNKCSFPTWLATMPNSNSPALPGGTVALQSGQSYAYNIPSTGWAGRFWPKTGCNSAGTNCAFGDSSPPCPASGCQPPADTKVEFLIPGTSIKDPSAWYDISLVDGYSLPVKIAPRGTNTGSCVSTSCAVSLSSCPKGEANGIGDLRVTRNGQTVACLSPCMRWNYPAPYGLGQPVSQMPGLYLCCPTPPVSSQQCIAGPVQNTQYVQLVRQQCPTAYSFAYDDVQGLHTCPPQTSFDVTLCP